MENVYQNHIIKIYIGNIYANIQYQQEQQNTYIQFNIM